MKKIHFFICCLTGIIAISCQNQSTNTTKLREGQSQQQTGITDQNSEPLRGFKKASLRQLESCIIADFNGDGHLDSAFYQRETGSSGILIKHGNTNEIHRFGFGTSFAHLTEFDWIDYWGLVEDKTTTETTFDENDEVLGSKVVYLQNPAIVVGAKELGGGLITFMDGKYVWIHQTC